MPLMCPGGPGDGSTPQTFGLDDNGSGFVQSKHPNLNAKRLNLSIMDVQRTIQEGRASGKIKLFNVSGSTNLKN